MLLTTGERLITRYNQCLQIKKKQYKFLHLTIFKRESIWILVIGYHANPSSKLVSQVLVMKWTLQENKNVENEIVLLTLSRVFANWKFKA